MNSQKSGDKLTKKEWTNVKDAVISALACHVLCYVSTT